MFIPKNDVFKIARKSLRKFGLLLYENVLHKIIKNAQSGHTVYK